MCERDLEVMRRAVDALLAGDVEALTRLSTPDVELISAFGAVEGNAYTGARGIARYVSDLELFELDIGVERLVQVGEHVIVFVHLNGAGRLSGVPVEWSAAHLWTLRGHKLGRGRVYLDPSEALRVAAADDALDGDLLAGEDAAEADVLAA
jgi:ketosteroid isomerase-like protein